MTTMKKAYIRPEATLIRIASTQILASSTFQADEQGTTDMQCSMRHPEEDWDE